MARIRTPERVKPVMAIWMSRCAVPRYGELEEILAETLSPIESKSDWFLPPETAYYRREMAPDLQKRVVSFRNLMSIDQLPDLKIRSNALEDLWREQGRRGACRSARRSRSRGWCAGAACSARRVSRARR